MEEGGRRFSVSGMQHEEGLESIAGFGGGRGPQAKEGGRPLEAGKGKEMDPPLEPLD